MSRRLHILLLALLVPSCGEDETGVPQPDPLPKVQLIKAMDPETPRSIDMVGLPGAVAGSGRVRVVGTLGAFEATSEDTGSFALTVQAKGGVETFEITYGTSDAALLAVGMGDSTVPPSPQQQESTIPPITAPVDGESVVRGSSVAGTPVLAANFSSGAVATGNAASDGSFELRIAASSGDEVRVYGHGEMLSEPWELTVP